MKLISTINKKPVLLMNTSKTSQITPTRFTDAISVLQLDL